MVIQSLGRSLNRIAVVDDNPAVRESFAELVEDLGATPVAFRGPLADLNATVNQIISSSDAVLADYRLMSSAYALFDGDKIISNCMRLRHPGILCTSYSDVYQTLSRSERTFIPAVVPSRALEVDSITKAFERAIGEIDGRFVPERTPWRTQVQIVEIPPECKYFYVIVAGWNPKEKIRLFTDDLPNDMHALVTQGRILHACVNTGARKHEELYFSNWEDK